MKINAKYLKRLYNDKHQSEITLLVSHYQQQQWLSELDSDKEYSVEIKEVKSKRSIQQNALLWSMLHQLELKTKQPMMEWYSHALVENKCQSTLLLGINGIENELLNSYRAVKKVGKRMIINQHGIEQEMIVYQCFVGSSKFTVQEMNELIDIVLQYCAENEIQTELLNYET